MTCLRVNLFTLHYYDKYHTVSVKCDTEQYVAYAFGKKTQVRYRYSGNSIR
jgi:hypothetical protein